MPEGVNVFKLFSLPQSPIGDRANCQFKCNTWRKRYLSEIANQDIYGDDD